jgi:hypothetical protein
MAIAKYLEIGREILEKQMRDQGNPEELVRLFNANVKLAIKQVELIEKHRPESSFFLWMKHNGNEEFSSFLSTYRDEVLLHARVFVDGNLYLWMVMANRLLNEDLQFTEEQILEVHAKIVKYLEDNESTSGYDLSVPTEEVDRLEMSQAS